jgi:hypothetical protein
VEQRLRTAITIHHDTHWGFSYLSSLLTYISNVQIIADILANTQSGPCATLTCTLTQMVYRQSGWHLRKMHMDVQSTHLRANNTLHLNTHHNGTPMTAGGEECEVGSRYSCQLRYVRGIFPLHLLSATHG